MHIYKELSIVGCKTDFDQFCVDSPTLAGGDWKYQKSENDRNYIVFEYEGEKADKARVYLYYDSDTWRKGELKVNNIVPLQKNQLSIDEYNAVLELFYQDILLPYQKKHSSIKIIGPTSDVFEPLDYISESALRKLRLFCVSANKSTGSSHPCDEQRWFDFICQTVKDERVFDYDTLFRFLIDEEYWGKTDQKFGGAIGLSAWDEQHASELALEYDNYVRFLRYFLDNEWEIQYEEAQK